MSTNKKVKRDNNNKIFQDLIDFEILRSLIDYFLLKNKNNNKNNNQYEIIKFYLYRNEILNYILVSKKWYKFKSLTISNNINNKSFEHWLEIKNNNYKSFIENYSNQNQYDKNNLTIKDKYFPISMKISFNTEFSIIKIQESIIDDYLKSNLFLYHIKVDDFKEIKKKYENNQLVYNRIVFDVNTYDRDYNYDEDYDILFEIQKYLSNYNSEFISNLFKILELNFHCFLM
ncbi:hypothetical protein ACTFIR_012057 [Dictyostelium discoideum]